MITFLIIVCYLSAHGVHAQFADLDQADKSCRDLGHCRSIWDIIWGCVATIFSCTWVALHLNIPKQGKGRLWNLGRRVVAFGIALIAPELIIMEAYGQRTSAQTIARQYKAYKWTLTHGFFANMGGFVVHNKDGSEDYVLDSDDIGAYLHNGQINLTEDEIQDKSKGDVLTKGFVVLQTSWFILQLIARTIQRLPITELEIATLAFAILNGATYALWWNKPLDVQRPIILTYRAPEAGADDSMGRGNICRVDVDNRLQARLADQERHHQTDGHQRVSSVPFLDNGIYNEPVEASGYILAAVGVLFGGIHCIAWSLHFPTAQEKLLWQIASLSTIILPVMFAIGGFAHTHDGLPTAVQQVFVPAMAVPYTIARLVLLFLAFTTLRSLPPDVYTTVHWTTFVPHI